MTTLSHQVREEIKLWREVGNDVTIAGYIRQYSYDGKWHGDSCGCPDDRCIGYHHDENADCGCFPVLLEEYARRAQAR